jgi:hypothetical protein
MGCRRMEGLIIIGMFLPFEVKFGRVEKADEIDI